MKRTAHRMKQTAIKYALFAAAMVSLAYLSGLPGSARRAAAQGKIEVSLKNSGPNSSAVKALFAQNCARCHGADGRGQTELGALYGAQDLTDAKWQKRYSDKRFARSIARGRGGMPSFAKKLSPEEIKSLVAYVRTLKD